jgi:hypothetical protein
MCVPVAVHTYLASVHTSCTVQLGMPDAGSVSISMGDAATGTVQCAMCEQRNHARGRGFVFLPL